MLESWIARADSENNDRTLFLRSPAKRMQDGRYKVAPTSLQAPNRGVEDVFVDLKDLLAADLVGEWEGDSSNDSEADISFQVASGESRTT